MIKTALALGTFDGVHKGHQAVLSLPADYRKIAVTFIKPPKMEQGEKAKLLMRYEDKCAALGRRGIDEVAGLHFKEMRDLSPEAFLSYLKDRFDPALISCGFNYRFGKGAAGNTDLLARFCEKNGIGFRCCDPVLQDGTVISSSGIRSLLSEGKIAEANGMMTEPFSFAAEVISGDRRGRTLGFPTVNQRYPEELAELRFGVYQTEVSFDGHRFTGMTNIGIRPTFKTPYVLSESFIHGFSGDLYGKTVRVTPIRFIRPERKFDSVEELKAQVLTDLELILK